MQDSGSGIRQDVNQDSITLGQLRAMVGSVPKPKVRITNIPTNARHLYAAAILV